MILNSSRSTFACCRRGPHIVYLWVTVRSRKKNGCFIAVLPKIPHVRDFWENGCNLILAAVHSWSPPGRGDTAHLGNHLSAGDLIEKLQSCQENVPPAWQNGMPGKTPVEDDDASSSTKVHPSIDLSRQRPLLFIFEGNQLSVYREHTVLAIIAVEAP